MGGFFRKDDAPRLERNTGVEHDLTSTMGVNHVDRLHIYPIQISASTT
jgi:hypothetical protein